jgi:hypothetical protein
MGFGLSTGVASATGNAAPGTAVRLRREQQSAEALTSIQADRPAAFHAACGCGKTALVGDAQRVPWNRTHAGWNVRRWSSAPMRWNMSGRYQVGT